MKGTFRLEAELKGTIISTQTLMLGEGCHVEGQIEEAGGGQRDDLLMRALRRVVRWENKDGWLGLGKAVVVVATIHQRGAGARGARKQLNNLDLFTSNTLS